MQEMLQCVVSWEDRTGRQITVEKFTVEDVRLPIKPEIGMTITINEPVVDGERQSGRFIRGVVHMVELRDRDPRIYVTVHGTRESF